MLETLDDPSIYIMSVEEPEKANPDWLDILNELTEQDIQAIQGRVDIARINKTDPLGFIMVVNQIRSLGIKVLMTSEDLQNMDMALRKLRKEDSLEDFAIMAAIVKQVTGDHELKNIDFALIEKELEIARETDQRSVVRLLYSLKILGRDITVAPEERDFILEKIRLYKSEIENDLIEAASWAHVATELGIELNFNSDDMSRMKEKLESLYREQKWGNFIDMAADMKYLSEHLPGLKVEGNLSTSTPPQPFGRDF